MRTASVTIVLLCSSLTMGNVFDMPAGLTSLDMVTVGNPGNAADMRYNLDLRPEGFGRVDYDYRIGKYEVTAGQYCEFLNAVGKTDTYGLYDTDMWASEYACRIERSGSSGNYSYSVAPDWANRPVNFVSWGDAARFANWLSNGQKSGSQDSTTTEDGSYRLNGATTDVALLAVTRTANWKWVIASEDEWYKAAYYKGSSADAGYWDYPTSSDTPPGRDLVDISGNNANYYTGSGPYPIDSGKYTTLVGEFQNSASPCGTFDQGGNVWEWDESLRYDGSRRGWRGGSFSISDSDPLHAVRRSRYAPPTWEGEYVGFRVVQVPEPSNLTLLAVGGLVLLRRRHTYPGR